MKHLPDFRSPDFLREHLLHTLAFYDGRALDPSGGMVQHFKDDGTVYDASTRHLVSSARFVIVFANAAAAFPEHPRAQAWLAAAQHALDFLHNAHRHPESGGYAWVLQWDGRRAEVQDATNHCYGLAFVLMAHAQALRAGLTPARAGLVDTIALMEKHFWEADAGLYADEATRDWQVQPYRGQNANMHACEAMLAAYEATRDNFCLMRATTLAESVTRRLAAQTHGLIWEHYSANWTADWDYNRHEDTNIYRPWGFQPGHLAEWAKLLLALERATPGLIESDPDNWMVHRARELFGQAVHHGWDRHHGGMVYGFAPHGSPATDTHQHVCDPHKYHWVQAETLAAAAVLAERTHDGGYWDWYDRLWAYVWSHFVDHEHGAWYRILGADNRRLTQDKSPAGKVDYHNMGACLEVMAALSR